MGSRREEEEQPYEMETEYEKEEEIRGGSRKKRMRFECVDDVCGEEDEDYDVEEEEEEEEEYYGVGRRTRNRKTKKKNFVNPYLDLEAEDGSDEEEVEEEEGDEDFIADAEAALLEHEDLARRIHQRTLHPIEEKEEDLEELEKIIQQKYSRHHMEEDEVAIVQQALLPCARDPKLWLVKCAIGCEREVAACLLQKFIDTKSELNIRSVIALDHLKSYIYIEADKATHVREVIKGLHSINANQKILQVPIKEMADVLSVQGKADDLSLGTWVRVKTDTYKGDLAEVVDVDNVRRRVTVKLVPRIDLQALANKLEGREVVKKRAFIPPPRLLNIDEARKLHIHVERRRDRMTGDHFEIIYGMHFKDGFLHKTVSMKSVSFQEITPTLDELEKFSTPRKNGQSDIASLSSLLGNKKRGRFVKGDAVIVVKGDLKNLKGWVEKVDIDNVFIRPEMEGLPRSLAVKEKELCKYFELGNHVKIVSGAHEGASGMVIKVEQHVVSVLSDTTKEQIRVFSEHVVGSPEVRIGVTETQEYKDDSYSKLSSFETPAHKSPFQWRFPQGSPTLNSGGTFLHRGRVEGFSQTHLHRSVRVRHDDLIGTAVKICQGPLKGYRGRVVDFKGSAVRVELESQMKIVTVHRNSISDNKVTTATPHRDTPLCETPLHLYMTTTSRDPPATPIHDGMRTPMRSHVWDPFTAMSPARVFY